MNTLKTRTLYAAIALVALTSCAERPTNVTQVDTLPEIWPDYVGVMIPKNIAPLNFAMATDDAQAMEVSIAAANGVSIVARGKEANFDIDEWREMVSQCSDGYSLTVSVSAKLPDGWVAYKPFGIHVSGDTLAAWGVTYRRIRPGYEVYSKMGIYERELSSFHEKAVFENTEVPNGCVNCHTPRRGSSEDYLFHIRGEKGGTLFSKKGKTEILNTVTDKTIGAVTYPAWHPEGRYVAFSVNKTRQSFHQMREKRLEVFDMASDIVMFDSETHSLITTPLLNQTDSCWETFPCFSADGRELFFCATKPKPVPSAVREIHYTLCKIAFDAEHGQWGEKIDTVADLSDKGLSISFPRTSADGRFLMFTACNYGTFPIWHSEADLWLLDLKSGEPRRMERINSDNTESFHNWSQDSRWVVLSSRRGDGLFTRLYFAHVDENGVASKPFLLPQVNPKEFYLNMMDSYNVPEFVEGEVVIDAKWAGKKVLAGETVGLSAR